MMKLAQLYLVLAGTFFFSTASAENLEMDLMICRISNSLGIKIGQIHAVGPTMGLKMGLLRNNLNVESIQENKIVAVDQGQDFEYSMIFDLPVQPENDLYNGTVYSRYLKGFGGLPIRLGNLRCTISVKDSSNQN